MAKEKVVIEHKDKLGRLLKVGDCVAYPGSNTLIIGTVKKLNPKMIGVARVGKKGGDLATNIPVILFYLKAPKLRCIF